ncbi:hypothetical protein [Paractinoplanes globisporus]|uniref:Uncharacterized protein n=1 Tax=Paractinoplanes globisporus TaxID=113565 RepID=A0ABW6WAI7_9ACTN|nr:hypothetical protein [Actinoplanes globisporus]
MKVLPVTAGVLVLALSVCSSAGDAAVRPSAASPVLEFSARE